MENELTIKRFIEIRRELGYTQAEFASMLGIPNTTADIERGRTKLSGKVVVEMLKQFKGVVSIEVFSYEHLNASLKYLESVWKKHEV